MSPEEHAARDAALEEAVAACVAVSAKARRDSQQYLSEEDGGDGSREQCQSEAIAAMDCAIAIRALRTTPPPAAPGEITQEQASDDLWALGFGRSTRMAPDAMLRDYWTAPGGVGPQSITWSDKPHRLLYDLIGEVLHLRAGLAGVPRS